jgi:catechol 2,3-dioxygenase-like lactoylglutathione lyase family enzyme
MSLKMRAQSHAGITVRDLDASVRFYRDLPGLEIVAAKADLEARGVKFYSDVNVVGIARYLETRR